MQRLKDAVAPVRPHVAKVRTPTEFHDELVLRVQPMLSGNARNDLGQRDEPVRDVRRQPTDGTLQCIAGTCIVGGAHGGYARLGR